MSARPRKLVRRPARDVPVALLGLAMLLAGAAGTWLMGARLLTGAWPRQAEPVVEAVAAARFGQTPVLAGALAAAVLGVVMIVAAIWPGRPARRLVLVDEVPGDTALADADLARRVRSRLEQVDGVHSARVAVTSRRARVTVRTAVDDSDGVRADSLRAARAAIAELGPVRAPEVRIRMRRLG